MKKFYFLFVAVLMAIGINAQTTLLDEDFSSITTGNNTSTGGSSTQWNGNDSFPVVVRAYQAGGAVKIGASGNPGSITSKSLDLSTDEGEFTLSFDVKGWTNVEGQIKVSVTGQEDVTKTYTATISDNFETITIDYTGGQADSQITIATTAKRAFIDNIKVITKGSNPDPTPSITADPTSFDFGQIVVDESSTASDIAVTGENLADAPTYSVTGTDAADFAVTGTLTTDGGTLSVIFTPSSAGAKSAELMITSGSASATVALSGTGKEETPAGSYSETFETQTALTGSYANGSFAGEAEGVTVNYVDARNEDTFGITGKGMIFKTNTGSSEFVIPNGVGTFTFEYRKAYSGGSNNRSLTLWVNGEQVAVTPTFGEAGTDTTVHSFSYDVNTTGSVSVKIANAGAQVTIDNVLWTGYEAAAPVLDADATSLDFAQVEVTTTSEAKTVTITGENLTEVPTYVISGTDAADFSAEGTLTTDGGTLNITFAPTTTGAKSAVLTITSGDLTKTVDLTGEAVEEGTLAVNNVITKVSLVKNTSVDNEIIFAQDAKVSLVNMNGQVVKTAQVSANQTLNVAALPKGVYVVTAVVNGKAVSQKIIKK